MNNISIENISFSYQDKKIFDNYSISFKANQTSVIMSPSGAGKTTLLNIISGIEKPDSGHIVFPWNSPRFSMVFQDLRLIESSSILTNIKLVNSALTDDEISDCLTALNIYELRNKKVHKLSGGEKQRVAIARALLAKYDILLLDEPFTGLDDHTKSEVINYIKNKTAGKTVLLVTHDKSEASLFCDESTYLFT